MTKTHCNICDRVIEPKSLEITLRTNIVFRATVEVKNEDVCKYCLIDAINKLDDRPKEAGKSKI